MTFNCLKERMMTNNGRQKITYVTIPIEEYRELLTKEVPTERDHEIFERTLMEVSKRLVFTNNEYENGYLFDNLKIKDSEKVIEEFLRMLKYTDRERYMTLWNEVMAAERERKAMIEKARDMQKAKEIRAE